MKPEVSRVGTATAVGLAVTLSLVSGGMLHARQDPPPAQQAAAPAPQADGLKFTQSVPHLIIWGIKPGKAADFEATWAMIRAQFEKSERPEVKEFAATFGKAYRVDVGPSGPTDPSIYVFEILTPSMTQSYNPGRIIYEFLWKVENGKEIGIPRVDADAIFAKLGNMAEMFSSINPWPLKKIF